MPGPTFGDPSKLVGDTDSPKPKPTFGGTPVNSDGSIPKIQDTRPKQISGKQAYEEGISLLPALGGTFAGIPGAAAGAFARQALTSDEPSIPQAGVDIATQGIAPELLGHILRNFSLPGLAAKVTNSTNLTLNRGMGQIAEGFTKPTSPILDTSASLAEDVPPFRAAPQKPEGALGDYVAGKNPQKVIDKLLSDPREIDKWVSQTGENASVSQLAVNNAISKGYNGVSGNFDPDKILTELGSKDAYKKAIDPETYDRLTKFLQKAKDFEPEDSSSMMRYVKHRLVFDLAAYGVGHEIGGPIAGGTSLILGNQAVSKLMHSEFLGNLALKSFDTAQGSQVSPILTKTILTGLRGTIAYMQLPDGSKQPVQIGNNGEIVPIKPQTFGPKPSQ